MSKSFEFAEQRNNLLADSRVWLDKAESEGRPAAEVEAEWDKRMADIDALEEQMKKIKRREDIEGKETELRQSQGRKTSPGTPTAQRQLNKAERNAAVRSWLGYGLPGVRTDNETMHNAASLGLPVHQSTVEWRSLNTSSSGAGGATTFTTTSPDLQSELKYYSPIMGRVNVRMTADGNTFSIPRSTDVANSVAIVAQSGASAVNVDASFDKVSLGAYMFRTIVQITFEMLQDSIFDVEGFVNQTLAERFARTAEKYIVSGSGSSQPTGLVASAVAADSGTAAVTLAATKKNFYQFEDLFSLFASVDLAYRPNNTLVLHDSSVWDLRRIKDSQGRYIWDVNNTLVQNGQPDKIAGFNYLISNSIDASGSFSKNLAVFADLSRYNVRMVNGIQLTRINELYRANGMVAVEGLMRWDGNYVGHAASIARVATPAS